MRAGEMFKMKWKDIGVREIHIPQTNTKTEESRVVGITPRLRVELERLWDLSAQNREELVFGIADSVKRSWKTACKLAGIESFRLHDCRHTATTRMIASGSPHTEVMKITGHSQLKTFLRYLNITTEAANRVANKLEVYVMSNQTPGL
jgi:integrase